MAVSHHKDKDKIAFCSSSHEQYSESCVFQGHDALFPDEITQTNYDIAISTAELCSNGVVAIHFKAKKKVAWIHPDYSALHADIAFDRIVLDQFDYIASVSETQETYW